jgi:hypothetical protein
MFNLSTQANLYLIVIIITTIINLICVTIVFKGYGFMIYALFALLATPLYMLYVYSIDCLTTGDCQLWSWVVAIYWVINLIVLTVFIIFLTTFSSTYMSLLIPESNNSKIYLESTVTPTPIVTTTSTVTPTPLVTPTPIVTPTPKVTPIVTPAPTV